MSEAVEPAQQQPLLSYCFVCRNPLSTENTTFEGHDGGSGFEFLCRLFSLPSLSRSDLHLGRIENSEFCEPCASWIREAMLTCHQIKFLETRLDEIKTLIKSCIRSSYPCSDKSSSSLETSKNPAGVLGRVFVQSWSDCKVLVPIVSEEVVAKQETRKAERDLKRSDRQSRPLNRVNIDDNNTDEELLGTLLESPSPPLLLSSHIESEEESVETYPCPHCSKTYALRKNLQIHVSEVHGEGLIPACRHCGMEFKPEPSADTEGSGINERPYRCHVDGCKLSYKTLAELRRHHARKCAENPVVKNRPARHECKQCGKSYLNYIALRYHIEGIHEQKFKLYCEVCGKGFHAKSTMARHAMVVHSTEKQFECEICKQRFKQFVQLKHHRRKHTGERPYVCEICGKSFHMKQRYRQHVNNTHSDQQVPCNICGKIFRSKDYVQNHINDTHLGKRKNRSGKRKDRREPTMSCDSEDMCEDDQPVEQDSLSPTLPSAHLL